MSHASRRGLFRSAAALVASLGVSAGALAGVNVWTSGGPLGGPVAALAVDPVVPQNVYAATVSGLYKTTNGGGAWARSSTGLGSVALTAVSVSPSSPAVVYVGTQATQVYRSTDSGGTWHLRSGGIPVPTVQKDVKAFAIDPADPLTVYAATDPGLCYFNPNGVSVYKTTDGGGTWTPATTGITGNSCPGLPYHIAIDPQTSSTIYVTAEVGPFYRSTNGGASWSGYGSGFYEIGGRGLAVAPGAGGSIYVNTGNGFFRSTNGGSSFQDLQDCGPGSLQTTSIAVDPLHTSSVYSAGGNGVCKSTDGGVHYGLATTGLSGKALFTNDLEIDPVTTSNLYLATGDGIYKSTNGGGAWALSARFAASNVYGVAGNAAAPNVLYCIAQTGLSNALGGLPPGIHKSTDGGATWTEITGTVPVTQVPRRIAVSPTNSDVVTVGGYDNCTNAGLYRTTNGGASWSDIGPTGAWSSFTLDPSVPDGIYAHRSAGCGYIEELDRSTNGGGSWTPLFSGTESIGVPRTVVVSPSTPTTLYGLDGYPIIVKSTDGGVSWASAATGLDAIADSETDLAVHPTNASIVYLSSRKGIFKTTDGGGSWTDMTQKLPPSSRASMAVALDPADPNEVEFATPAPPSIVYRSTDAGVTWRDAGLDVIPVNQAALLAAGTNPARWHAGTVGGVFSITGAVANGDANLDGAVNVADVFYLVNFLFAGGPAPLGPADANNNGVVNVTDVFYLINFLFAGGPSPL